MRIWGDGKTLGMDAGGASILRGGIPMLAWRYDGEIDWRWDKAVILDSAANEPDRLTFTLRLGPVFATMAVARRGEDVWELSGDLCSDADRPVELARFHYLQGVLTRANNLLAPTENRFFKQGETLAPHQKHLEQVWGSLVVEWPRLADPIHAEPDWAVATDVAILLDSWTVPGLVVGFTGPGVAFGEIGLRTLGEPVFYIGVRLDNILVKPRERRTLERVMLAWGDWQDGLREWAGRCARELGARPIREPLVGWCSWYQYYSGICPEHVRQAAAEFASWPIPPGGRLIQIDDGFQIMPGDWRPHARFHEAWADMPREIAASGSIPGLWLAPTKVFHRHPIVKEHPEWLQRLPDGRPAVSFSNWGWCDRAAGGEPFAYGHGDIEEPVPALP